MQFMKITFERWPKGGSALPSNIHDGSTPLTKILLGPKPISTCRHHIFC